MAIPHDTVWYIEARPKVQEPGFAPERASMGSAVAVELETLKTDGTSHTPPQTRKYLLTCGHVVRDTAKDGENKLGWGAVFLEICCFPPNGAYSRTFANSRRSGVHEGVHRAEVHKASPFGTALGEVTEIARDDTNDWILLNVLDTSFQRIPAVGNWDPVKPDEIMAIVGYPGGAGNTEEPIFQHLGLVESLHSEGFRQTKTPSPNMLVLDGPDEARAGMSGGGVFSSRTGALLGIHRASRKAAKVLQSISIMHIRDRLEKLSRMRPVQGLAKPPAPPDPSQDLTAGTEPLIPFINRGTLRGHLQKIIRPESQHKGISLIGSGTCGKTWSRHLIAHVARRQGMRMAYVSLAAGQSLKAACQRITRDLMLNVPDMKKSVLDDQATDETVGQKFAFWLTTALTEGGAQRAILLVDDIVSTAGVRSSLFEELVLPIIHELKSLVALSPLVLILIGETFPADKSLNPFVLSEHVEPLTEEHVVGYLNECAARRNRLLSDTDRLQILLEITGGVSGQFDGARMEAVMLATQRILEKGVL